jgi:MerR family transcriptional regulator, mercuric resistance operon regulatory protein
MEPDSASSPARTMTIGALSQQTGVNIETIRYYERIGLLPKPPRSEGGRRLYASADSQRLIFVRRARELGFPLNEVRELLGLAGKGDMACGEAKALTERHIAVIRRKVRDLKRLDRVLSALSAQCREGEAAGCPILGALGSAGAT